MQILRDTTLLLLTTTLLLPLNSLVVAQTSNPSTAEVCQPGILDRLQRHRLARGETVQTVAQRYSLLPETLIQINPVLQQKTVPIGTEILIPPFNGVRLEAPPGSTWKDLEKAYGVGADILFELNGCQKQPKVFFLPGVQWFSQTNKVADTYTGFPANPLPMKAPLGLAYGWQQSPTDQQPLFHSGVDLLAEIGTPVVAVDEGVVAFAGEEGSYGNLVVINHAGGRQTRYAHLATITVQVGQEVKPRDRIGTVGTTGKPDIPQPHLHFEVRYNSSLGWLAQDPKIHFVDLPWQ